MNKEQAYEKLELPVGADLQVVRQKFQQMHNDFQVQIDGSFSAEMRQRKQQQFAELEEAFKLLMGTDSTDISRSTPYTGKTFDIPESKAKNKVAEQQQDAPIENKQQPAAESPQPNLQQALAVFGLHQEQDSAAIENQINNYIKDLQQQEKTVNLPSAKQLFQAEITKAEKAALIIKEWQSARLVDHTPAPSVDNATIPEEHEEVPSVREPKWWYITVTVLFIISTIYALASLIRYYPLFAIQFFLVSANAILSTVIILNRFSSLLVPPFLRRDWLQRKPMITNFLLLAVSIMTFDILLHNMGDPLIFIYDHCIDDFSRFFVGDFNRLFNLEFYAMVSSLSFIYWLIMGTGFVIGLLHPKKLYFKGRKGVLSAFGLLLAYHLVLMIGIFISAGLIIYMSDK